MIHQPFPTDWRTALVLVPHPDDPEYGCAAAVAKWTSQGKHVYYALACRGEVGIAGMSAEECGPLREREQRLSSAIVGVDECSSGISRTARSSTLPNSGEDRRDDHRTGARCGDHPLQRPGVGAGRAEPARPHRVLQCRCGGYDSLTEPPRWFFENGPHGTHGEVIDDDFIDVAVASLAAHDVYLSVHNPDIPVLEQARKQVDMTTTAAARNSRASAPSSSSCVASALSSRSVACCAHSPPGTDRQGHRSPDAGRTRSSPRRPTPGRPLRRRLSCRSP